MLALPLDYISGFLFGINANRVRESLREKLIRYQEECYTVLNEAFREGRLTADPAFSDLLAGESPAAQAYKMARAMMELARNQLLLESRLSVHDLRLDDYEKRLEGIEATLGDPSHYVTPDQASQLYRRFGITSYKQLPAAKFDEAMTWLNEWREGIEGDVPF
jgi:hypothetical protein